MQGLDPAVQDLGRAGELADLDDRHLGLAQGRGRAAGGDQLDALGGEPAAELDQAGLVVHGQQGAADRAEGHAAVSARQASRRRSRATKKPSMPPRPRDRRAGCAPRQPASARTGRPLSSAFATGSRTTWRRWPAGPRYVRRLLGLQRADGVDQHPAGLEHADGGLEQPRLRLGQPGHVGRRLAQGTSGWRRIVPVAVQGASSRTAANGAGGRHSSASATTISASIVSRPRLRTRNSARRASARAR